MERVKSFLQVLQIIQHHGLTGRMYPILKKHLPELFHIRLVYYWHINLEVYLPQHEPVIIFSYPDTLMEVSFTL